MSLPACSEETRRDLLPLTLPAPVAASFGRASDWPILSFPLLALPIMGAAPLVARSRDVGSSGIQARRPLFPSLNIPYC